LLHRHVHEAARLEEEFRHFDIRRDASGAQIDRVFQIGVIAEHPFDERPQKAFFQIAGTLGDFYGDRGHDLELQLRIGFNPPVERIHQGIGLADPEGNAEYDTWAHPGDDVFHTAFDILKIYGALLRHDPISPSWLITTMVVIIAGIADLARGSPGQNGLH